MGFAASETAHQTKDGTTASSSSNLLPLASVSAAISVTVSSVADSKVYIHNESDKSVLDPNSANADMDCLPQASAGDAGVPIPRRNLSEAFEELYVSTPLVTDQRHQADNTAATTPAMKQQTNGSTADPSQEQKVLSSNLISPTGVVDLHYTDTSTSSGDNKTTINTKKSAFVDAMPLAMADPIDSTIAKTTLPPFQLHADLQMSLSQAVINRVSFYHVIHDSNKEATTMAANDDSGLDRASPGEDLNEDCSPLVESVKGPSSSPPVLNSDIFKLALIDEERWLLSAIKLRGNDENRSIQSCPPTFLQAMGEREYENPLTALSSGSRTQLWKPGRRSVFVLLFSTGFVVCVDFVHSHLSQTMFMHLANTLLYNNNNKPKTLRNNKFSKKVGGKPRVGKTLGLSPRVTISVGGMSYRLKVLKCQIRFTELHHVKSLCVPFVFSFCVQRYLWPLIHYHKFLAKCIKKLKRNGVDVKQSVTPVAAFLREEVCAVSDHLASVSLFDSDKWMDCLQHFLGWTDTSPEADSILRDLISQIELRPLSEHGDVDSPLLRSQIDEHYLRAMAAQRAQMDVASDEAERKNGSSHKLYNSKQARNRPPHHMHQVRIRKMYPIVWGLQSELNARMCH